MIASLARSTERTVHDRNRTEIQINPSGESDQWRVTDITNVDELPAGYDPTLATMSIQIGYPYGGNPFAFPGTGQTDVTFTAVGVAVPDGSSTAILFAVMGAGLFLMRTRRHSIFPTHCFEAH